MIVLDASAAIEILTSGEEVSPALSDRLRRLERIHVPELFDLEVLSALRGLERARRLDEARSLNALQRLAMLRIRRWRHRELREDIWRRRHRHSVYDATYIALAKFLDLPLVTADSRLAGAVERDVAVELYA